MYSSLLCIIKKTLNVCSLVVYSQLHDAVLISLCSFEKGKSIVTPQSPFVIFNFLVLIRQKLLRRKINSFCYFTTTPRLYAINRFCVLYVETLSYFSSPGPVKFEPSIQHFNTIQFSPLYITFQCAVLRLYNVKILSTTNSSLHSRIKA